MPLQLRGRGQSENLHSLPGSRTAGAGPVAAAGHRLLPRGDAPSLGTHRRESCKLAGESGPWDVGMPAAASWQGATGLGRGM